MAIGGLIGLLDDIAALAKLTAASLDDVSAAAGRATAKAAGVVVDDTAVTPQYLQGVAAEREREEDRAGVDPQQANFYPAGGAAAESLFAHAIADHPDGGRHLSGL